MFSLLQQYASVLELMEARHLIPILTLIVSAAWAVAEVMSLPKSRKQLDIPRGDWLTAALGLVPVIGVGLAILSQYFFTPEKFYPVLIIPSLLLCFAGIGLRTWSKLVLGRFYTFAIGLTEGHRILTGGPYRFVRHPLYLGTFLAIAGFPLLTQSWAALCVLTIPTALLYGLRLVREDAYLVENLGPDYRDYAQRTARLIPFVW